MPRLDLRLDDDDHQALRAYAEEKGINISAAARMLLAVGLEKVLTTDQTVHIRAVREGVQVGRSVFMKALQTAIHAIEIGETSP